MLVAAAIGVVAALAALAILAAVVRRRRAARAPSLALGTRRRPAGVSHLATRVSELSDLDMHLHGAGIARRRLGELLGSSTGASR